MYININRIEREIARLEAAYDVAGILTRVVERAIEFGHVSEKGLVQKWTLYRLLDRDDVSGDIEWAPNLGWAQRIVEGAS